MQSSWKDCCSSFSSLFIAYCLWKAKSSHFPSRSVSAKLPFFLWGLFVYMPKWIFVGCTMHTGLICSCIYYILGWCCFALSLWVYLVEVLSTLFHGINMQCSHKWQHGGDHIPSKAKWKCREGLGGKHWIKVPNSEKDLQLLYRNQIRRFSISINGYHHPLFELV